MYTPTKKTVEYVNEYTEESRWFYKPANMYFKNLAEAKVVLGTNRMRKLLKLGRLICIGEDNGVDKH